MQHTAMSSFSSTSFVNSGWTTVLHATNVDKDAWTVPGWVEFEFTTPFDYDGVSNLLVDYCVDNSYVHIITDMRFHHRRHQQNDLLHRGSGRSATFSTRPPGPWQAGTTTWFWFWRTQTR